MKSLKALLWSLIVFASFSCSGVFASEHLVLGVSEFESLPDKALSFETFRRLKEEPGYLDWQELQHVEKSGCWDKAETAAANQFRERIKGISEADILDNVGSPLVRLGPTNYWNKSHENLQDWLYFFGFRGVPVRLRIANGKCKDAFLLTDEELLEYIHFMKAQFKDLNGMPEEKAIERFGKPSDIKLQFPFKKEYTYNFSRVCSAGMTFNAGKCTRSGIWARFGWLTRAEAQKKNGPFHIFTGGGGGMIEATPEPADWYKTKGK